MWKTIIISNNKKKKTSNKGFITIEIIIAMLIAFGFLMVSLQTLVLGMVFKVGATKEQRADKVMQEEIERIRNLASVNSLALGVNRLAACSGNTDLDGDGNNDGYGKILWNLANGNAALTSANNTSFSTQVNLTPSNPQSITLTITGDRNADPGNADLTPHRMLGISYEVTEPDVDGDGQDEIIARRYVEVIPDEALECP